MTAQEIANKVAATIETLIGGLPSGIPEIRDAEADG